MGEEQQLKMSSGLHTHRHTYIKLCICMNAQSTHPEFMAKEACFCRTSQARGTTVHATLSLRVAPWGMGLQGPKRATRGRIRKLQVYPAWSPALQHARGQFLLGEDYGEMVHVLIRMNRSKPGVFSWLSRQFYTVEPRVKIIGKRD